jgi:hypothetical protein
MAWHRPIDAESRRKPNRGIEIRTLTPQRLPDSAAGLELVERDDSGGRAVRKRPSPSPAPNGCEKCEAGR